MITKQQIDNWFTHHPATPSNAGNYLQLSDQSDAIRKVREAVMIANASIACSGG